jgi:hypothetical protein
MSTYTYYIVMLICMTGCGPITHYSVKVEPYTIVDTHRVCNADKTECKVVSETIR